MSYLRAFVGDVIGKCRILDIWNNQSLDRLGGNNDQQPDPEWSCQSMLSLPNSEACVLHKNGIASFYNVDSKTRKSIVHLGNSSNALSCEAYNSDFVACYSNNCCIFNREALINSFEVVENPSCATSFNNLACYGRINDRTIIYDITNGSELWTSSKPDPDELGLDVQDDDRSLLFLNENSLLVGQNESFALLYDIRQGKSPVIKQKIFEDFPLTALSKLSDNFIVIADTIGSLTILDLRITDGKQELVGHKGYAGSPSGIISIQKHPSLNYFSTLSCDRVIRLYSVEKISKLPEKTAFVRTKSNCFIMLDDSLPENPNSSDDDWAELPEDGDGIWANFVPCPQGQKDKEELAEE